MATDEGLPIDAQGKPDMAKAPAWARWIIGQQADTNEGLKHLHDCLHRIEGVVQGDRHEARNRDMIHDGAIKKLEASQETMSAQIAAIAKGLGVPGHETDDAKPKKTLALISRPQAIAGVLGSIGGALLLLKVLDALLIWLAAHGPELWRSLVALG